MLKIPITYLGFDGKEKKKDFFFNLTKGEITEIHLSLPNGLDGFLEKLHDDPNVEDVIEVFKKLILKSYGKRTATNAFIKSKEISEEFAATDAYSELFLMFLENKDDFVNKFLDGVIQAPPGTLQKIIEENDKNKEAENVIDISAKVVPTEGEGIKEI
jgi:hypothetical protein